jgi:hypothetical protein
MRRLTNIVGSLASAIPALSRFRDKLFRRRDQRIAALSYLADGGLSMILQGAPASESLRAPSASIS